MVATDTVLAQAIVGQGVMEDLGRDSRKSLPQSDTGGTEPRAGAELPFRINHHWAEFTVNAGVEVARSVLELLLEPLGGFRPDVECRGIDGYSVCEGMLLGEAGDTIGIRLLSDPKRPEAHVIITGQGCEWLGERSIDLLDLWANPHVSSLTRWDIAFDGWREVDGRPVDPRKLFAGLLLEKVQLRSPVKRESIRGNMGLVGGKDTLYLGSKASDRMMRFYNSRGFTRGELVFRGERLQVVRKKWGEVKGQTEWAAFAIGLLRDYVDVVEPGDRPSRCALVSWWEACVGAFEKASTKVVRPKVTLAQKMRWLEKCVLPTLAVTIAAAGYGWFGSRLAQAESSVDYREVLALRSEVSSPEWDPSDDDVKWEAWLANGGRESIHAQQSIPF